MASMMLLMDFGGSFRNLRSMNHRPIDLILEKEGTSLSEILDGESCFKNSSTKI